MRRINVEQTVDSILDDMEDRRLNYGMNIDLPRGLYTPNIEYVSVANKSKAVLFRKKERQQKAA